MGSMVLYVGLTQATSLSSAAEALLAAAPAAPTALRAALDWHKARLDVRRHELFFLYESTGESAQRLPKGRAAMMTTAAGTASTSATITATISAARRGCSPDGTSLAVAG